MDPRKRDEKREEERKASLRKGSAVIYSPIESAFDSPDPASGRDNAEASLTGPDADRDAQYQFHQAAGSSQQVGGSHLHDSGASREGFSFFPDPSRSKPPFSRDPSPRSPGMGPRSARTSVAMGHERRTSRLRTSQDSADDRSTNVKARGGIEDDEEDDDEEHEKEAQRQSAIARPAWGKSRKVKKQPLSERLEAAFTTLTNTLLRRKTAVSDGAGREVPVEVFRTNPRIDIRTNGPYTHNMIRSSKYSYWSFLPRQIFFQFSKLANVYFLCISILQMIPGLSTTGTYTTIIPLMVFVTISMAKEGLEDLRRHKLDKIENRAHVTRAKGTGWDTVIWQNLHVGDVVRLHRDETVPADLILLHVEGAEDRAYVETMALDGETNLKNKGAPDMLQKMGLSAEETLARNDVSVHAEDPNLDLYNFSGNISVGNEKTPLSNDNILYRGSILRNTKQVLGLVIYTGEECKIRMNATKRPRIKAPRMQALVNKVVLFIVALVVFLAILLSVLYLVHEPFERHAFYITNATVSLVQIFVSFIIMLNTMIPLSLYVSMEIVKVSQIGLMMSDIEMYDPVTNTPMEARTSTINEELGQVSYVFSDKTGTLTDNIMKFRSLSVAGTAWLHAPEAEAEDYAEHSVKGRDYLRVERPSLDGTPLMGRTEDLIRMISDRPDTNFARQARFFILCIALCHTCVSERTDGGIEYSATSPDEVALAQAAQEMGFVFIDRKAGTATVKIPTEKGGTTEETYQILDVLEFSSKRKRMSLVVRMPDGRVCVFTKGADSIIKALLQQTTLATESSAKVQRKATMRKSVEAQDYMRRKSVQQARFSHARTSKSLARISIVRNSENLPPLSPMSPVKMDFARRQHNLDFAVGRRSSQNGRPSIEVTSPMSPSPRNPSLAINTDLASEDVDADDPPKNEEAETFEKCFQHIDYFATDGLRTLLYAYRYIDEAEYSKWHSDFHSATTSLTDRDAKIEEVSAQIEQHLELAGATAIEDKLQDGVPLAIDRLRRAGIKVWVLTGDKRETAINIGRSAQLIKDFSKVAIIDHEVGDLFLQIQSALSEMRQAVHSVVVVDGQTLSIIEGDENLFDFFHALAVFVDSVLCCRASPAQKAFLVKSIRTRVPKSVTLAIGDGSNDVAMIQEAHVGIGIAGREGLQAARTSDYSIAQFRFLVRLLLVHGRWNYLRICKYTLGTFWKEMLFFLTQAMFQMYNGYTGTSLYESWSLSMFNTLFTSLPVIFLGIFEKDLSAETLIAVPELYNYGQRGRGFNLKVYLGWAAMAAGNAALIFYLPLTLFGQAPITKDNQLFAFGDLCFTAGVLVINMKLQFWEIHYKTFFAAIALVLEIGGWFLWNLILSAVYHDNGAYKVKGSFVLYFGRDGLWWLTMILSVGMCFAFEMAAKMGRQVLFPNDVDVHQKLEKDAGIWEYIETAAHAGDLHEEPGSNVRQPPKRTHTQQMRRDEEYNMLVSRSRSGTMDSRSSRDGLLKQPAKLVRFLTREEDSKPTLQVPSKPPGMTPLTGTSPADSPKPNWDHSSNQDRQDIEMLDIQLSPIGMGSEPAEYFGNAPGDPASAVKPKGKNALNDPRI